MVLFPNRSEPRLGELPGMPAASALLTAGSIASLEAIVLNARTTFLSASTATSRTFLRGILQSRATCAGLGHRTVRKTPGEGFFGGVAEGVRIFFSLSFCSKG